MNKRVKLVCDLQYGSTGKGLLVGYLCEKARPGSAAISAMAPNAGHTYVADCGTKYVHSACPVGIVFPHIASVGLGPGSIIDVDKLLNELRFADEHNVHGCGEQQVLIHERAVVLTDAMADVDSRFVRIGSTMKGSGSAAIARIERQDIGILAGHNENRLTRRIGRFSVRVLDHREWLAWFDNSSVADIVLEGSQGYSLGVSSGMWPYTTYRECTPAQILSDSCVPCSMEEVEVYGVMRTFPIRVANRYDEKGIMIGFSGPCYRDQYETSWEKVGVEPEKTTVTKLTRRVFTFSFEQFEEAYRHTRPDVVFLNFVNYLQLQDRADFIRRVGELMGKVELRGGLRREEKHAKLLIGYGAKSSDIVECER